MKDISLFWEKHAHIVSKWIIKVNFAITRLHVDKLAFNDWVLYKKPSLTVLEDIRLTVSTLHSAVGQPDRPLLSRLALSGLLLLFFLLLHADNHILGVEISVGWRFVRPGFTVWAACRVYSRCSSTFTTRGNSPLISFTKPAVGLMHDKLRLFNVFKLKERLSYEVEPILLRPLLLKVVNPQCVVSGLVPQRCLCF